MNRKKIRVCLIGLGHWGPNFVRAVASHPAAEIVVAAEVSPQRRAAVAEKLAQLAIYETLDECLRRHEFEAVIVAVPTEYHHRVALQALAAGKHVLVEKPLAHNTEAAHDLVRQAAQRSLVLMTGHIFLYNNAIVRMKEILDAGEAGTPLYLRSVRTNLGPIRQDVNALWDLAAHDIAIFNYLFADMPLQVSCSSFSALGLTMEDLSQGTLVYPRGRWASFFVSWLDPQKKREITLVGERKMIVFDDMNPLHPLKVFDKGVKLAEPSSYADDFHSFRLSIRDGAAAELDCPTGEPLRAECAHFIECIRTGAVPRSDGRNGVEVVNILEALGRSAAQGGGAVNL